MKKQTKKRTGNLRLGMCVNFIHSIHHKFLFDHAKNIHRRRATTTLKKTFKIIQITYAEKSHKKDEINQ